MIAWIDNVNQKQCPSKRRADVVSLGQQRRKKHRVIQTTQDWFKPSFSRSSNARSVCTFWLLGGTASLDEASQGGTERSSCGTICGSPQATYDLARSTPPLSIEAVGPGASPTEFMNTKPSKKLCRVTQWPTGWKYQRE